jgi:DNA-binding NarL/FixJ family response regulator
MPYSINYIGTDYRGLDVPENVVATSTDTDDINKLFQLVCSEAFSTDLIILSDKLFKNRDVYNVITSLQTIINDCTCHPTKTKIAVSMGIDENPITIKKFIGAGVAGIYPMGDEFSADDRKFSLYEMMSGGKHIPSRIKSLITQPKKPPVEKSISLTPREEQIVQIIHERGSSNKVIARMLHISESTVKLHLTSIYKKYGVKNRTQLALFYKDTTEV